MKNYPILSLKDFTPYKGYIKYLEELNSQVFSLFQYSEYFMTDYRQIKEEDGLIIDHTNKKLDITQLSFHNFFQLDEDLYIQCGETVTEKIAAGTVIISNAREEGTTDLHPATSPVLTNINNYFFQPLGWSAYYVPFFYQKRDETENRYITYYRFVYDAYAEEDYGNDLYFSFDTYFTRYFINRPLIEEENYTRHFKNNINAEVTISAKNIIDKKDYIIDRAGKIWSAYMSNPVMGFTFLDETESDYGEEIITDSVWNTTTFERSNIARYTIVSRDASRHWPKDNEGNPRISVEII